MSGGLVMTKYCVCLNTRNGLQKNKEKVVVYFDAKTGFMSFSIINEKNKKNYNLNAGGPLSFVLTKAFHIRVSHCSFGALFLCGDEHNIALNLISTICNYLKRIQVGPTICPVCQAQF